MEMKVRDSMSDELMILLSFLLFMCFFAGVGLASMRVKEDTTDDYLVAGRGMHPGLAALSAVSTWNSGHVHWIHWIHLFARLLGNLDCPCINDWPARRLDLVVQVHSARR